MNNTKICTNICELVLTFFKLKIALFSALHNSLKKSIVICHFPEMRMSSHNSFLNSQKKINSFKNCHTANGSLHFAE